MANELKITDVVDEAAIKRQFDTLRGEFKITLEQYESLANKLAGGVKVNPKSLQQLTEKSLFYNKTLQELIVTQNKLAAIQERHNRLISDYSKNISKLLTLHTFSQQLESLTKNIDKVNSSLDRMSAKLNQASNTQQHAEQSNQSYAQSQQQVQQAVQLTEQEYAKIISNIAAYDNHVTALTQSTIQNEQRIKELKKELKALDKEYKDGKISVDEYLKQSSLLKQRQTELAEANKQNARLIRNHSAVLISSAGSYNEMSAAVLQLENRFKNLSSSDRTGEIGQGLLNQIATLKNELKSIDAQMGNYQRNVGNYTSHWNGLNMSVQQMVRELPSLAIGWNTFFLAISNNLPILADELKRTREELKQLNETGQKGTPIWKQLGKSLLSWQTLLVVGITLLSTYGKDIIEWVKSLFSAEQATQTLISTETELSMARRKGIRDSISETTKLDVLYKATQNTSKSIEERTKAVDELQKRYPSYFANMSKEGILSGKAKGNYQDLRKEMVNMAIARAQLDRITEIAMKREDLLMKAQVQFATYKKAELAVRQAQAKLDEMQRTGIRDEFMSAHAKLEAEKLAEAKKSLDGQYEKWREIRREVDEYEKTITSMTNRINVSAITSDAGKEDADEKKKQYEELAKYQEKIDRQLSESRLSLIENEREAEIESIHDKYQQRMSEIKGNTSKENELRKNLSENMEREISAAESKYAIEWEQRKIENKLALVKEGSDEELSLRLQILDIQREEEINAAEKNGDDVFQIDLKYQQKRMELVLKFQADKLEKSRESLGKEALLRNAALSDELDNLAKRYADGLIKKEEYEREAQKLTEKYAIDTAKSELDILKQAVEAMNLPEEERMKLKEEIARKEIELAQKVRDAEVQAVEDSANAQKEKLENISGNIEKVGEFLNQFSELSSNIFDRRIQEIEEEQDANDEAGEKELERIQRLAESGAISEEEAEARKRAAEEKTTQRNKELEKQKAELQTRQAKFEKANNILQATINTAAGIMKTIANVGFPAATPLIAAISAMGAVQVATIAAQPIPKYAKGTKKHPGGLAIVGDGGQPETIVTERGAYITPAVPTLVDIPKNAQVIPEALDIRTIRLKSDALMLDRIGREKGEPVIVNVSNDYRNLEKKFDNVASGNAKMVSYMRKIAKSSEYRNVEKKL